MKGQIAALGYVGLEVSSLKEWEHFASSDLGLHWQPREDATVDLRLDEYASRIRLHEGPRDDLAYIGWEVPDEPALKHLANRLRELGVTVEPGSVDEAEDRRVKSLIRFEDPEGTIHEAFFGPLKTCEAPFVSPRGVQFRTGRQGLGHVVLACDDIAAMTAFFIDVLGFRVSDYINTEVIPGRPIELVFMRCNGRHHSLALAPVPIPKKIVHLMVEVLSIDDVGRALDRCNTSKRHLSFTLGRHSNDEMLSFYPMTPSGFDFEYGWGGLEVEDESWHVVTHQVNSSWGHQFQPPPRPPKRPNE